METIKKRMSEREYLIFTEVAKLGLTPKILNVKQLRTHYMVEMEKYEMTLFEYADFCNNVTKEMKEVILTMTKLLHKHNILHGDLHGNNIVLNNKDDIKIIDFGKSYFLHEIDSEIIEELNKFWGTYGEKELYSLENVLLYEESGIMWS